MLTAAIAAPKISFDTVAMISFVAQAPRFPTERPCRKVQNGDNAGVRHTLGLAN
jgi:hypothetical protein